jgi:hypothetical protein
MRFVAVLLVLVLAACGSLPSQDLKVEEGANAVVTQQQDAAGGAKVQAEEVKDSSTKNVTGKATEGARVQAEAVRDVTTKNVDGIPVWWFMVGCFLFGALIPQPRWLRWVW